MAQPVWVNILDNHSKVWGYDFFSKEGGGSNTIITYYGKIGLSMQNLRKTEKEFNNYYDARDYVMQKIKEKEQKGYIQIPNHKYFGFICDNRTPDYIRDYIIEQTKMEETR